MHHARIIRIVLSVMIGVMLAAALAWNGAGQKVNPESKAATAQTVAGVKVGGPYTLTDHTGKTVTDQTFKDYYKLIYFGFTYCPAICPTELQKMAVALNQSQEKRKAIKPIFITIDPERDTQNVMATYVAQFIPELTGLTGTQAQIDDMLKTYKVYARKVPLPDSDDYTMDHSSHIFLMTPDDTLISVFGIESKPSDIVKAIEDNVRL